jgi:hypothetical protein
MQTHTTQLEKPSAPAEAGATMNDDPTICRHCGGPNETYFFVCPTCWKQLPQPHRAAFGALKIKCFSWLREFAPQRNPTSTPQKEGTNQ